MNTPVFPIPDFFDVTKVGTVWRIPYEERAKQARDWARQHAVKQHRMFRGMHSRDEGGVIGPGDGGIGHAHACRDRPVCG